MVARYIRHKDQQRSSKISTHYDDDDVHPPHQLHHHQCHHHHHHHHHRHHHRCKGFGAKCLRAGREAGSAGSEMSPTEKGIWPLDNQQDSGDQLEEGWLWWKRSSKWFWYSHQIYMILLRMIRWLILVLVRLSDVIWVALDITWCNVWRQRTLQFTEGGFRQS